MQGGYGRRENNDPTAAGEPKVKGIEDAAWSRWQGGSRVLPCLCSRPVLLTIELQFYSLASGVLVYHLYRPPTPTLIWFFVKPCSLQTSKSTCLFSSRSQERQGSMARTSILHVQILGYPVHRTMYGVYKPERSNLPAKPTLPGKNTWKDIWYDIMGLYIETRCIYSFIGE